MPQSMPSSIGMSARWKPISRPIQYIGRCRTTPAVTATQPAMKAQRWRRSARTRIVLTGRIAPGSIELPLVALDLDDDAGALVEPEVVVLRHRDDAVRDVQVADVLERIAQRDPELARSRRALLQGDRDRLVQLEPGVPGVRAERRDRAGAVDRLVAA